MVGIVLAAVKVVEVDSAVVAKFTRAAVGNSHGRFFVAVGRMSSGVCRVGTARLLVGRMAATIYEALIPPSVIRPARTQALPIYVNAKGVPRLSVAVSMRGPWR